MTLPKLRTGMAGLFSGGRAPDCWQKEISPPAAAPRAIERACRWLEELAGPPPRLQDEPLLGRCLPELLDAPAVAEQPAPDEQPRASRRRPKTEPPAPARRSRTGGTKMYGGKPQTHAAPSEQPARAPQALLESYGASRKGRRSGAAERPAQSRTRKQQHAPHLPIHGRVTTDQTPPVSGHDSSAWAGRLVERVRRRALGRAGRATVVAKGALPLLPGEPPGGGLAAQWERLLAGERVPAGTLARLADAATGKGRRSRGAGGKGAKGRPAAGEEAATRALKDEPAEERPAGRSPANGRSRSGTGEWPARRRRSRGGRKGDDGREEAAHKEEVAVEPASVHERGRHEPVDEHALAATRFQPPQMVERLPPLRPPLPNGLAIPAAAAAAARSARAEAAGEGDDLDELARQLRKLLEEESRRYGIDV